MPPLHGETMSEHVLNRDLLPGNACFGCGHENPHGLRIEVVEDGSGRASLAARFEPPEHAGGFPGLTHGGALFTAMDCLATWVVAAFGPRDGRYRLLGSADAAYRKAAPVGRPLRLEGRLLREEGAGDGEDSDADAPGVLRVRVRVEDRAGDLVAEGTFTEVPVTPERLRALAGIDEIPPAWQRLFEDPDGLPGGRPTVPDADGTPR